MAKKRIRALNSIKGCSIELSKIYREARQGDLDLAEAKSLTWILKTLSGLLSDVDFEQRLQALEELDAQRNRS